MHPDGLLLSDYIDDALEPEERNDIQRHLDDCVSCRAAVADLRTLTRAARALRDQTIEPPARVWASIERATGRGGRYGAFGSRVGLATAAVLALAVSSALVGGGVALGRRMVVATQPDPQLTALRQELHDTRQMVMLSLLQQQSASERLNGVMWTNRIENPGNEVVAALLDTLMHDSNINVRLATIDALKRFGADTAVRRGAVEALGRQTSPLVQIALIDFIADTKAPGSADVLRRLSEDQMVDQAVRTRAALAAQRVG